MMRKFLVGIFLLSFFVVAAVAGPPKDVEVASEAFANVADNSWTTLAFAAQPPGEYYLEMTDLTGNSIGCWGAQVDKYADGSAWQDGEALEGDLRMQYTPDGSDPVELVVVAPQGAIGDNWFPFGLQEAEESIGQSFIAPDSFTAVALNTPTWNTADSGCTLTLYAASSGAATEPAGKLASTWGSIKSVR